jgi:hypothetical protein
MEQKRQAAVMAKRMGDDSLWKEYNKLKKKRREDRVNILDGLGLFSSTYVCEQTGYSLRAVNTWAKENGIERYGIQKKYGWSEKDIEIFVEDKKQTKKGNPWR